MKTQLPGLPNDVRAGRQAGPRAMASRSNVRSARCRSPSRIRRAGEEGKVVHGVPLSATGAMKVNVQDTVVEQTIIEKRAPGDGSDTLIDMRANQEVKKGNVQ